MKRERDREVKRQREKYAKRERQRDRETQREKYMRERQKALTQPKDDGGG